MLYHPKRGWLDKKLDADNKGCQYTYTSAGRLKTKTLARGIVITYTYDAGIMVKTDYSDNDTLDVTYQYDSFGRVFQVDQGENVNRHVYAYNPNNLLLDTETITYGLNTANPFVRVMDHSDRDTLLREKDCLLRNDTVAEHAVGKAYDAAGRLETITHGGDRVHTYNYVSNTYELSGGITSPEHSVINTYEPTRNVLDIKSNQVAGVDVSRYDYGVNDIGQRVTIECSGSAFASAATETAGYNVRGEVVQTTIPNQQGRNRIYNIDGLGNRTAVTEGNVETSYVPNLVNEYATVGETTQTHDDDGNLTDNGTFTYKWDAENRLLSVTDKASNNVVIDYKYDYQSRRIERNNSEGKTNWIYHGWNPCGQYLDGTFDRTYTWGTDLSGSQQGAGGVGGLLAVTDASSGNHYYPTFDGNGNISEYINEQQEIVAHYEYDAFGSTVVSTGEIADYFEHRFSTKPIDEETGFYYYGYRYYDPETGRWPSRDPIAEQGGVNLYGFISGSPINFFDKFGLQPGRGKLCCKHGGVEKYHPNKAKSQHKCCKLEGYRFRSQCCTKSFKILDKNQPQSTGVRFCTARAITPNRPNPNGPRWIRGNPDSASNHRGLETDGVPCVSLYSPPVSSNRFVSGIANMNATSAPWVQGHGADGLIETNSEGFAVNTNEVKLDDCYDREVFKNCVESKLTSLVGATVPFDVRPWNGINCRG